MHQPVESAPFSMEVGGRVFSCEAEYQVERQRWRAKVWEHTSQHDLIAVVLMAKQGDLEPIELEFLTRCGVALIDDAIYRAISLLGGMSAGARH